MTTLDGYSSNITSLGVERFFINVTYNDTRSQSGGSLISKLINMTVETVIVGIRNINNGTETNVNCSKKMNGLGESTLLLRD